MPEIGLYAVTVSIYSFLQYAQGMIWPQVQIGSNFLENILGHVIEGMAREDVCSGHRRLSVRPDNAEGGADGVQDVKA